VVNHLYHSESCIYSSVCCVLFKCISPKYLWSWSDCIGLYVSYDQYSSTNYIDILYNYMWTYTSVKVCFSLLHKPDMLGRIYISRFPLLIGIRTDRLETKIKMTNIADTNHFLICGSGVKKKISGLLSGNIKLNSPISRFSLHALLKICEENYGQTKLPTHPPRWEHGK